MRPLVRGRWVWICLGLLAGVTIAAFATGCASILHGTLQPMSISSTPTGANVTVDGTSSGSTPMTASLSRKHEHTVKIEMQGYKPMEVKLNKGIDGWFWGNLLLGGLVGMIIDGSTGAMYKLSPSQIDATLKQEGLGVRVRDDQLLIGVTLTPDPAWQKIGQLQPDTLH